MKMLYTFWLYVIAVLAAIMVFKSIMPIVLFYDPTGGSALYNVLGFLGIFLVSALLILHQSNKLTLSPSMRTLLHIVLTLVMLEVLAFIPCLLNPVAELCGLGMVLIHQIIGPVALISLVLAIPSITPHKTRNKLVGGLAVICVLSVAWYFHNVPKNIDDCQSLDMALSKGQCIKKFAVENKAVDDCRGITLQFLRYSCISDIARSLKDPTLCDHIETLPNDDKSMPEDPEHKRATCLKGVEIARQR